MAFGSSTPRAVAAEPTAHDDEAAEVAHKLQKYRAKLEESEAEGVPESKRQDYALKLQHWTAAQERLQRRREPAEQPQPPPQARPRLRRTSAPSPSDRPSVYVGKGDEEWRVRQSPRLVKTGEPGSTPKRVKAIDLAQDDPPAKPKARSGDGKAAAAAARVDGASRARRRPSAEPDSNASASASSIATAAAAAVATAGEGGEALVAKQLRSARMRLREAQTPWANTPKSKIREIQLQLAVWERMARAVRLP